MSLNANDKPAVLVVDDEEAMRALSSEMLEMSGFATLTARNTNEALSILESDQRFAAVLTDVEMPGSANGLALAVEIRKRWPQKAVLIMSGGVSPPIGALPAGVGFIPKPFNCLQLVHQLERLLVHHWN